MLPYLVNIPSNCHKHSLLKLPMQTGWLIELSIIDDLLLP